MQVAISFVFFDLPSKTNEEKKKYRIFRRNLIRTGYVMLQESVYYKYLRNSKMYKNEVEHLGVYKEFGSIKIFKMTEKEFKRIIGLDGSDIDMSKYNNVIHF